MTAVSYLYCLTQGANMPLEMPPYTANGGHAVLLIGWDEQKQAFLCKNSWGTGGPNGDGTFWISYGEHLNDLRFGMANFDVVSLTCNSNSDCDDGTDNDGDGLIDCSDPDCSDLLIKRHTSLSPSKKIGRNSSISRFRKYEFSVKKCI